VAGAYGDEVIGEILQAAGPRGQAIPAIENVLGVPIDQLSEAWHASLRRAYEPIIDRTTAPDAVARALLTAETAGGNINVGPSISPDGRRVAFLSERDLFSIDLFVADTETGDVIRRLVRTAADPHFDTLQFISSAGGWHPDGRQFVFSAVVRGRPVLTIVDAERGGTVEEIPFDALGEIFNPSFSPDGTAVAFVANATGFTDLYVYQLESGELRRLIEDMYAAHSPVWSPDGRRLAFATDRFTTNLETLNVGTFDIAAVDLASGQITRLAGFKGAKNLNPMWGPDGQSLYFLSNREGIPNIYRTRLDTGEIRQVTNITTGVSGITPESPAFSVASGAERLVFSAFEDADYNVYLLSGAQQLAGVAPVSMPAGVNAAILPPRKEAAGPVFALLQEPRVGLPEERTFPVEPYRAGLSLDFIGQPTLAVGNDRFGTFLGGGISSAPPARFSAAVPAWSSDKRRATCSSRTCSPTIAST
jgi:Tol biopolymer transport system component